MSEHFRAVGWNPPKRRYDAAIAGGVAACLAVSGGVQAWLVPQATVETLIIRSAGITAIVLLHVILSIGPLCRLDRRFLPLLYNRRHLGVTLFLVATIHGGVSIVQFHGFGDENPFVSVLTASAASADSVAGFPFQPFGLLALVILFLMAATSHDFWLRALTPPVWKTLHMLVYVAYVAVVLHVVLGLLQTERDPRLAGVVGGGVAWVLILHTFAGQRERRLDQESGGAARQASDPFVDACGVDDIPDRRARIVCLSGERIAIFRYGDQVSAVSNVCQHQNGPLGEGRIVNSCIVCPWHGYEYEPATGAAPAPFTEKVPTFRVRIHDGRVLVDPTPYPPGTRQEPARISGATPMRAATSAPADRSPVGLAS